MAEFNRSFAEIDLSAIDHNLSEIKKLLTDNVKTLAVVKADAYGHGLVPVAKHIESKVDYFAVATVEDALELRENSIRKPVIILSYTSPLQYDMLLSNDITATIYNVDEAKLLSDMAAEKGKKVKIHIPVDTGMGRIGFTPDEEGVAAISEIAKMPGLYLEGLFSHYALADCKDKTEAYRQSELFDRFIEMLEAKGVYIPIKHINNSAGTIDLPKKYDMCRVGIALYGLYPSDEVDKEKLKLKPAMEVFSHIVHLKTVTKGTKIGYGHIYEAPSERRIATISIGYADGYKRCLTGVGYVLVKGRKAPIAGKICMDQFMADVTDIPDLKVGDTVVIMGRDGEEEISAEKLGSMCHSFNYEIICSFMPRVKRIYK
ncbi:MAG: alanine racemase [Clostridia bacterium]|nr:alanine racemase [Clostridia bacterium]